MYIYNYLASPSPTLNSNNLYSQLIFRRNHFG